MISLPGVVAFLPLAVGTFGFHQLISLHPEANTFRGRELRAVIVDGIKKFSGGYRSPARSEQSPGSGPGGPCGTRHDVVSKVQPFLIPPDETAVEGNLFESMKWPVEPYHDTPGHRKPLSFEDRPDESALRH